MSVTFFDSSGKEISRERFQSNQRQRETSGMTYTGVTRFPDGREVVEERTEKGGDLIRRSTRRVGVEVTDTRTGKTETLYTDSLPAAPRQRQQINVAGTAQIDPTGTQRFIPALRTDGRIDKDRFVDVQEGQSIERDEMESRKARDGDRIRYRVEGRISPRDPNTSTTFTRAIDDFKMPSLYETFTGKKAGITQFGEDFIKSGVRTQRDIVVNQPYLIPVAAGVGAVTGGLGIVAPKVATGIAVSGKTLLSGYLGFQIGKTGAAAFGIIDEKPADVLGSTAGSLALLGSAGAVGAKAGAFTASKVFPVQTPEVSLRLPRDTSYQRDVLTERLTTKQVIDLSRNPAQLQKSTITIRQEVPDTAISGFQRFSSSFSAPDFGAAQTAPTKIITKVVPVTSVPKISQKFTIQGRLTPKGLVQTRAFQPITGKRAELSFSPDVGTTSSPQILDVTRTKIAQFSTGRFLPMAQPRTNVIIPALGTSRSTTQNIEDVSARSQPFSLTTTQANTTNIIDSLINVRGQVVTNTVTSSGTQPLISTQTTSTPTTQTDSPALSIPDIGTGLPSSPITKSPVFKFPNFKLPPVPKVPVIPNFNVGFSTRTRQPRLPKVSSSKSRKGVRSRKTREEFEGIFDFKGLSLDLGRRRLI